MHLALFENVQQENEIENKIKPGYFCSQFQSIDKTLLIIYARTHTSYDFLNDIISRVGPTTSLKTEFCKLS